MPDIGSKKPSVQVTRSFIGLYMVFAFTLIVYLVSIKATFTSEIIFQFVLLCLAVAVGFFILFSWHRREKLNQIFNAELLATIEAISRSQCVIEFDLNGDILKANDRFLSLMGYRSEDILKKHYSIFLGDDPHQMDEYREFWTRLSRGEYFQAEIKRYGRNNRQVWLWATYSPILDIYGKPVKIIEVSSDITKNKAESFELETMTGRLKTVLDRLVVDGKTISTGIGQIEASAFEQASSASEQTASVNEISTSIEEMKATSSQTLAKAKQLGDSAVLTKKESEKGRHSIDKMTQSMNILQDKMNQISITILSLNDKTLQISEITESVADIAKQSKMLALNASIEAAKAGESGKGFAVVAGEVKDLAERSQQATDRVQKILQDIRQTAEHAVMVAEDGNKSVSENKEQLSFTDEVISSLSLVIDESATACMQIVGAVREGAVAIDQLDIGIREISKVTDSFNSATEQTKDSIVELSKVVESLKNTVTKYEVSNPSDKSLPLS